MRASTSLLVAALLACASTYASRALAQEEPDTITPIELALFSPVHIFHSERKLVAGLSVNLIYGQTWRQIGLEVGVVNHEIDSQVGLQIGLVNVVEGEQGGIQLAGLVNVTMAAGHGLVLSGLWNHTGGGCRGICIGPIGNSTEAAVLPASGEYTDVGRADGGGVALAGLFNFLGGSFMGLMLSGGSNFSAYSGGVQIGIWNTALLGFGGIQIALVNQNGQMITSSERIDAYTIRETTQSFTDAWADGLLIALLNLAQRSSSLMIGGGNISFTRHDGAQLGAFNLVGGDVVGLQIGVVNVADEVDGVQIGAVNIVRRLRGVQIGGLHIAYESPIPFLVGVNVGW